LQHEDTIGTSELCRHIAKHGSIFTSDVVKGVVEKFVNCFEELLLEGYKLKLDGLGTFYLSIKTKAAPTAEDFTAQNVKAVRVKFLADQSKESEYTTRILTQKAKFRSLTDSTDTSTGENGNEEP
jgi:predicted histone-like DNA-binding protein